MYVVLDCAALHQCYAVGEIVALMERSAIKDAAGELQFCFYFDFICCILMLVILGCLFLTIKGGKNVEVDL